MLTRFALLGLLCGFLTASASARQGRRFAAGGALGPNPVVARESRSGNLSAAPGSKSAGGGTERCDTFPGRSADVKITRCIAALPATGGIADARGIVGPQTLGETLAIAEDNAACRLAGLCRTNASTVRVTTTTPSRLSTGQRLSISNSPEPSFDGTFTVRVTDPTHFTYRQMGQAGSHSGGAVAALPVRVGSATKKVALLLGPATYTSNSQILLPPNSKLLCAGTVLVHGVTAPTWIEFDSADQGSDDMELAGCTVQAGSAGISGGDMMAHFSGARVRIHDNTFTDPKPMSDGGGDNTSVAVRLTGPATGYALASNALVRSGGVVTLQLPSATIAADNAACASAGICQSDQATVTMTTTGPHGFVANGNEAGNFINLSGITGPMSFLNGTWAISSVPSPTKLTLLSGDRVPIGTHSGGGSVNPFPMAPGKLVRILSAKDSALDGTWPLASAPAPNAIRFHQVRPDTTSGGGYLVYPVENGDAVEHNFFRNISWIAVSVAGSVGSLRVCDNTMQNNWSQIDVNGDVGGVSGVGDAPDVTFCNNKIDGGGSRSFLQSVSHAVVDNNTWWYPHAVPDGAALTIFRASGGPSDGITVTNNHFIGGSGYGLNLGPSVTHFVVSNNFFDGNERDGLLVSADAANIVFGEISGNYFRDNGKAGPGTYSAMRFVTNDGIVTAEILIANNKTFDDQTPKTQAYGVSLVRPPGGTSGAYSEFTFNGNDFANNLKGAFDFPFGCINCHFGPNRESTGSVELSYRSPLDLSGTAARHGDLIVNAPRNGTLRWCLDCMSPSNPCSGGGTGALAVRQNGAWKCL